MFLIKYYSAVTTPTALSQVPILIGSITSKTARFKKYIFY